MQSWAERQKTITEIAGRQLFFVGGAPRSGTTWLQQLLDAHPDIICQGEGLFLHHLASPLEKLMADRRKVLEAKNTTLFTHTGGYPLPRPEDTDFLAATAILLGFSQQAAGRPSRAIGEKTPENVFFFARLRQLFPDARFIGIARDPRDVLASAWHFFQKATTEESDTAKTAFVRHALPSLSDGARVMLDFARQHPDQTALVTYETLLADPAPTVASLFRLLGVDDAPAICVACIERTAFAAQAGRPTGVELSGSFFRKGVAGDWRSTFSEEINTIILGEIGWCFPEFGWDTD